MKDALETRLNKNLYSLSNPTLGQPSFGAIQRWKNEMLHLTSTWLHITNTQGLDHNFALNVHKWTCAQPPSLFTTYALCIQGHNHNKTVHQHYWPKHMSCKHEQAAPKRMNCASNVSPLKRIMWRWKCYVFALEQCTMKWHGMTWNCK